MFNVSKHWKKSLVFVALILRKMICGGIFCNLFSELINSTFSGFLHPENFFSNFFQIEMNTIVCIVIVFLLIMNQTHFRLVH